MTTFKDFGLSPMILQALTEIGFETPTPVQGKTIPYLINGERDLIALAQTGTGKTAAFALPIIHQLDFTNKNVQTLILCPTRELAIQIARDIETYTKYLPGFSVAAVYGGERMDTQIRALKKNPQIVVGTPGRVDDMINRGKLKIHAIRWLVLDEADEMLNMGFKEDLDKILETTPADKQVLLFSATMNRQIRQIASNYMKRPEEITVGDKNKGADSVEHFYYVVHEKDRYKTLRRIADLNPDIRGIVFCRTRRETQKVADQLVQDHYSAEAIHGDISQAQRTNVMDKFRNKKIQLLVATDVAARGIDVSDLTHIINYSLPESGEAYVHRSGRTGRANKEGSSLLIVNMREQNRVRDLERKIGKDFKKMHIPTGSDICEKQLFSLVDKIRNIEVNEVQIGKYLTLISKKFEDMDREEILKKFISVEFNRFLRQYQNATDLNSNVGKDNGPGSGRRKLSMLFARFNLSVGKNHGVNVKELLTFMNDQPGLNGVEFGNIDIQQNHTLVEVDQKFKEKVLSCFKKTEMNGEKVKISCEKTGIESSREGSRRSGRRKPNFRSRGKSQYIGRSQSRRRRGQKKRF